VFLVQWKRNTLAVANNSSLQIPQLDGLRGIAIFLVIVWHYVAFSLLPEPGSIAAYAMDCLRLSWSGVDLFFVLSGFLIGGILIDNQKANNYFKVFYVRRVFRILPLYFSWLFLFSALLIASRVASLPVSVTSLIVGPIPLWSYATFSQNLLMSYHNTFGTLWMGITWSLAVEEQFYCVLPFVIRYLKTRMLPWFLLGCILIAPLLRVALSFSFQSGALAAYVLMPCRADALLLGALCAWMVRQQNISHLLKKHIRALYLAFVILLFGAAILAIKYDPYISYGLQNLGYTWLALLYSCLLLIALTENRGIIKLITMNFLLRKLGKIAYGVYLIHSVILSLTHELIYEGPKIHYITYIMTLVVALTLTLILAGLSWRFFEKPLVAIGHRLRYQRIIVSSSDGR
jgi:peptidoglycan/LPS O-acetylase OafA/YrhL